MIFINDYTNVECLILYFLSLHIAVVARSMTTVYTKAIYWVSMDSKLLCYCMSPEGQKEGSLNWRESQETQEGLYETQTRK